jgi:hypothetical protein
MLRSAFILALTDAVNHPGQSHLVYVVWLLEPFIAFQGDLLAET